MMIRSPGSARLASSLSLLLPLFGTVYIETYPPTPWLNYVRLLVANFPSHFTNPLQILAYRDCSTVDHLSVYLAPVLALLLYIWPVPGCAPSRRRSARSSARSRTRTAASGRNSQIPG